MTFRRLALAAIATSALVAAPALAAPDHSAVLSADSPKFDWQGAASVSAGVPNGVRESIPCKTPLARPCEDVLLEIKDAGRLTVKVDGGPGGPPNDDVDVTIYKSDKSGTAGDQVGQGIAAGPDSVAVKVVPGFYLAQVEYYRAKGTAYTGSAVLVADKPAAAPVVPTVPPVATTPPATSKPAGPTAQERRKAKLKKCRKAAKKIKNSRKRKKALKRCARSAKRP